MLVGIGMTVGSWLVLVSLYVGLGSLVSRPIGLRLRSVEDAIVIGWLGWAVSLAALQIVHIFAPIDRRSLAAFALAGAIGLWREREAGVRALRWLRARFAAGPAATMLRAAGGGLLLLWLGNRAMGMIAPQGDAGLYHLGAIRWTQSFPLLPGHGNLDGKIAYNNSLFVQLAMLDVFEGPPHFFHLGFPPLLISFGALTALHLAAVVRQRERVAPHRLLASLWLGGLLPYYFLEFPSTGTDTTAMMLGLLVGTALFRVVFEPMSVRVRAQQTFLIIAFSTVAVSIKLSFAFFGSFACAIAIALYVRALCGGDLGRLGGTARAHLGELVLVAAVVLVVLGPWATRGVIQSGYVAFPSSAWLAFDVDWRIPEAERRVEADSIKAWARFPFHEAKKSDAEVLASFDWVLPWLGRTLLRVDLFTLPMLLFLVVAPLALWRARRVVAGVGSAALYLASPCIGFVLWFVTAPAERFGGAIFWLLGAGAIGILFAQSSPETAKRRIANLSLLLVAASSLGIFVASVVLSSTRYGWALLVPPGPERGFHPIPQVEVSEFLSGTGLIIHVPVSAESPSTHWAPPAFCWDAPRPCTLYPKPGLELREPPGWGGGFRVGESTAGAGLRCQEPRPERCTREFVPVGGRGEGGSERSYDNFCAACADLEVVVVRSGACE